MTFDKGSGFPIIRIRKIVMENFKNVSYGEVVVNAGNKEDQFEGADILGLYGQNGSGKTAVIDALTILKDALAGSPIDGCCSELIMDGADYSKLSFTFDYLYPESHRHQTLIYSFKIGLLQEDEYINYYHYLNPDFTPSKLFESLYPNKVRIFDEVVSGSGEFSDGIQKMQPIIQSDGKSYPIGPVRKLSSFVGKNKEKYRAALEEIKDLASRTSRSFLFAKETTDIFGKNSEDIPDKKAAEYYYIYLQLIIYAQIHLFVVDTGMASLRKDKHYMGFYTQDDALLISLIGEPETMAPEIYERFKKTVNAINVILPALVTDLKIEIEPEAVQDENDSILFYKVNLFSVRNGCRIPLRDESAGLIRIIGILALIIRAFNEEYVTVAIDELDAGIYEYLLGEILGGLETYGKGQFIFTSHNLRPLEVLRKENILFTTTNSQNRYIRLKGVGHTNNLRSLYLREILSNSQDEQIYDAAKKQQLLAAFMRAGDEYGEE